MIPPGYRSIRVLLPKEVHSMGDKLKGDEGWDEFITGLIIDRHAEDERDAKVPARKGGGK